LATLDTTIGIVGTGRIAQAMGRLLRERGDAAIAIAGRSPEKAAAAAAFIGPGVRCVPPEQLPGVARRIVIAVSDQAIGEVAEQLARAGGGSGIALHTCGAHGAGLLAPLGRAGLACGVCHPLQTVASPAQGVTALPGSSFLVDGDPAAREWGADIVRRLGGRMLRVPPDRRVLYHAAAVLASNCVVALLAASAAALSRAGVPEEECLAALGPLVRTSVDNALALGPVDALTGPIRRGDAATVRAHLEALQPLPPALGEVYRALGLEALSLALLAGLPRETARLLDDLLRRKGEPNHGIGETGPCA
jgi:predicted short-subunit dehydrogenase-like oxidoreductase (DUF2520 family)